MKILTSLKLLVLPLTLAGTIAVAEGTDRSDFNFERIASQAITNPTNVDDVCENADCTQKMESCKMDMNANESGKQEPECQAC